MIEVRKENLRQFLEDNPNKLIAVMLSLSECNDCAAQEENLDSTVVPALPDMIFRKMFVDEDYPIFAPAIVPSIVYFYNGFRVSESLGIIEDFEGYIEFAESVYSWTDLAPNDTNVESLSQSNTMPATG